MGFLLGWNRSMNKEWICIWCLGSSVIHDKWTMLSCRLVVICLIVLEPCGRQSSTNGLKQQEKKKIIFSGSLRWIFSAREQMKDAGEELVKSNGMVAHQP
jgi:hypothetical protein